MKENQNKISKSLLARIIPGLSSLTKRRGLAGKLVIFGAVLTAFIVVMTLLSPWLAPYDPSKINVGRPLTAPNSQFPLGTDNVGRDMLSRVLAGGGVMLQVAVVSVLICMIVGVPLGLFSSHTGGAVDKFLSLIMDSVYAFPGIILAIAFAIVLGRGVLNMALSIAVVYVPSYFRVIRSQVLSIKELPYVEAATSIGAKRRTILRRYILPNVLPSIVVVATVNFADAILTAAGLTFIGLGVPVNVPDWGWDLTNGRSLLPSGNWWVITFPGIMIILLALGFTLMGEGLSELLNPRLEQGAEK
ncbi:MAG: ABC transporter permease [Candidatus Bathyarchaeia archaeon]